MSTQSLTRSNLAPSLFDDFFKPWNELFENEHGWKRVMHVPSVNIAENKDRYKVTLAAPGMKKEDFNVNVEDNILTISADQKEAKEVKDERTTRMEYNYTSFSRSFTLPEDVKQEAIDAKYENGVLVLVLPRKEDSRKLTTSKKVAVK
jgi:HSP20 family protein